MLRRCCRDLSKSGPGFSGLMLRNISGLNRAEPPICKQIIWISYCISGSCQLSASGRVWTGIRQARAQYTRRNYTNTDWENACLKRTSYVMPAQVGMQRDSVVPNSNDAIPMGCVPDRGRFQNFNQSFGGLSPPRHDSRNLWFAESNRTLYILQHIHRLKMYCTSVHCT